MYFGGEYTVSLQGHVPCEVGREQMLAGLATSIQTVGSLLSTSWLAKPGRKVWQKLSSVNSLHWKKHSTTFDLTHLAKAKI